MAPEIHGARPRSRGRDESRPYECVWMVVGAGLRACPALKSLTKGGVL